MARVVHFEIQAADPERLAGFYAEVFSWEIKKWDGPADYWLITTGPETELGINGALVRREEKAGPGQGAASVACIIDVPDIDRVLMDVSARGGTVVSAKRAIPGVGWVAYFADPEGTVFGLMQADSEVQ